MPARVMTVPRDGVVSWQPSAENWGHISPASDRRGDLLAGRVSRGSIGMRSTRRWMGRGAGVGRRLPGPAPRLVRVGLGALAVLGLVGLSAGVVECVFGGRVGSGFGRG
jgi:hypothetical protein